LRAEIILLNATWTRLLPAPLLLTTMDLGIVYHVENAPQFWAGRAIKTTLKGLSG